MNRWRKSICENPEEEMLSGAASICCKIGNSLIGAVKESFTFCSGAQFSFILALYNQVLLPIQTVPLPVVFMEAEACVSSGPWNSIIIVGVGTKCKMQSPVSPLPQSWLQLPASYLSPLPPHVIPQQAALLLTPSQIPFPLTISSVKKVFYFTMKVTYTIIKYRCSFIWTPCYHF